MNKTKYTKYKYHIALTLVLMIGAFIIQTLILNHYNAQANEQKNKLIKTHKETVLRIETGINVYSTVVSSLKSFIQNSNTFPKDTLVKSFLHDLIKEIDFKDSIIVSFIDTNQIFKYSVTPTQIDPFNLKGIDVSKIRPQAEVDKLNKLMYKDEISLFAPINLIEGWAAFPFNFSARNNKNQVLGYIAPVLNVKYLLDYSYKIGASTEFVHSFIIEDSFAISREVIYDNTKIYNPKRDPEFYKNFDLNINDFEYSNISFYGLKIKIGTAFKVKPKINKSMMYFAIIWYSLICIFAFVILNQTLKNKILNQKMRLANVKILDKNNELNANYKKIQTLLKEIHHRVKNNMQIISSLLNLQRNNQKNKIVNSAIDTSKSRIQSMALVHQKLYGSSDFNSINVNDYVSQLIVYIESAIEDIEISPKKSILIDHNLILIMDTMVLLGLILNELITNSYKYAFNNIDEAQLYISIKKTDTNYELIFSDNGEEIPEKIDISNSNTLGLELINILSEQLQGSVKYSNHKLSTFVIQFLQVK